MGVIIRQGLKASIITYIGAFLGYLLWLQLFAKWLSSEELGFVKALFDATVLLVPFIQGGVSSLIVKFSPYLQTKVENEKSFLGFALLVPALLFIVAIILVNFFSTTIFNAFLQKSPLFAEYIWYVLPMAFLAVYVQLVEALIHVKLRIVVPRFIREIVIRLLNIIAVWFYFMDWIDLKSLVFSFILINGIQLVILILYYVNLRKAWITPSLGIFKTRYVKPLLNYSGFMILGTGSGGLVSKVDSLMMASILGLTETGIYGIAFFIATIIELPRRVFSTILSPIVAAAYHEKDFSKLKSLYQRSSLNLMIVGILVFIGIWSNLDLVYHFIPKREIYEQGKWVFFYLGAAKVFDMAMGVNSEILQNSKYYRWNIYLTPILAVVAISTNLLLIPIYGIEGAALATLITVISYNAVRYFLVKKKLKISPLRIQNLYVLILAAVSFILTEKFGFDNILLNFGFNALILFSTFFLPILLFNLNPDFALAWRLIKNWRMRNEKR